MNDTKTPISEFLTPMPHSIEPHQTLAKARAVMDELRVRHLPVRSGGKLIGILSERDLYMLATFEAIDFKKAQVIDAMTPDPYTVLPTTRVRDVVKEMTERRIGSTLVTMENGTLCGIFTESDALRALTRLLGEND